MIQSETNARYLLVKTIPEELESLSMADRTGPEGCCDQLTLTSEGITMHVRNKIVLGTYVKDGYVNGRISYKKTQRTEDGYAYLFHSKDGRGSKNWWVSSVEFIGTPTGYIHFFEQPCSYECPGSCRGGAVYGSVDGEWKIDTTLRLRCACEDLASWCLEVQPNCEKELAKRKCRRYCGLCNEPCEDKVTWCQAADPNCNTQWAKENCKKHCVLC